MTTQEPGFEVSFFQNNRQRLRELFAGTAPIIITANGALQSDSYAPFPFRQDSNFWYLTGINDPDFILVMHRGQEYLIVPERTERQIIFDGKLDYKSVQKISGINEIITVSEGWERLGKRIKSAKHVATLQPNPVYIPELAMYSNPARRALVRKIKSYNAGLGMIDLRKQLAALRSIKSKPEIAALQYAIDHTIEAYKLISKNLSQYANEQSLAADVARYFAQNQLRYSYGPIIAGGERATILHYSKNNAQLSPNECLLIDMGAATQSYYCADITRTFAVKPTKRMLAVHTAVLEVQEFARDYLKPGVLIKDYETAVYQFMGEKLRSLGLIRTISQESVRQFYPHGTSHFLGLDVHDVGDYTKPLEPGMVLTVEPGIYIEKEAIGIRIEDDIVITPNGNKLLSKGLSRDLTSL